MIIHLKTFIREKRNCWSELENFLDRMEKDPGYRMNISQIRQFHLLYQRASADLAKLMHFSSQAEIRRYLESLVSRAYGEIHETRHKDRDFSFFLWFFHIFPRTFRTHIRAFFLCLTVMLTGSVFGGAALLLDPEAKDVLMPFPHLQISPSERVAAEENAGADRMKGAKTGFSSYLMTHNIRVSVFAMALGMTWGIGTLVLIFYNGVILGAVCADYMAAGETQFLLGWLLPHGSVEIPAILLAGQAGLVLAGALTGRNMSLSLKNRLRNISGDLLTLICGVGIMLVWAGLIEAFFSQYHEPVIPYALKTGFGIAELFLLVCFLGKSGTASSGE